MELSDLAKHAGEHVADSTVFEFPFNYKLPLPKVLGFQLTKIMVLELVVAGLMLAVFIPLAKRIQSGKPPKGLFWNFFETMLVFIRDDVARSAIGKHDGDKYTPFLWNIFFFVLFCNLVGMLPWAGSPTTSIMVTGVLAAITFCIVVGVSVLKFGVFGFFKNLVPHMELPKPVAIILIPMIFIIELASLVIKHAVLAIRLLANMFGGHLVLAVFIGFIAVAGNLALFGQLGVSSLSILGAALLSLLELFVAFLQAYIFTFLSALFIGMSVHPH